MGKLDKRSRKGINFYGFVDKSTCKYAIPFFFCRGNFFFIIAKKTVGFNDIFVFRPSKNITKVSTINHIVSLTT